MEDLAPPLELLLYVRNRMECGEHIRSGIHAYLAGTNQEFRHQVRRWLLCFESNTSSDLVLAEPMSVHRRALLRLLEKGLHGRPIHQQLIELEHEIVEASAQEVQERISTLPVRLLVPLLLLLFPSYMILLVVPFLKGILL